MIDFKEPSTVCVIGAKEIDFLDMKQLESEDTWLQPELKYQGETPDFLVKLYEN